MVVSVLQIDVDDSKFQRFKALFDQYQAALDRIPAGWRNINQATGTTVDQFGKVAAALLAQNQLIHDTNKEAEKQTRAVEATDRAMTSLARSTREVAHNIYTATTSLLKWGTITTAASGLLGLGGLWGIDRLGLIAGGALRSSSGLGVSSGEQQAFEINYGRYVDAGQTLQRVASAKSDLSQQAWFAALGINDVDRKNPAQLAAEAVQRAHDLWGQGDHSQQFAQANGILQFFSMDEWRRIGGTSQADLNASRGAFGTDAARLAVDPVTQRAWQNLTIALDRAGTAIENTLVKRLEPLTGPLEHLSDQFSHLVDTVLARPELGQLIKDVGDGFDTFARYIGTQKFKDDVVSLVSGIGDFAIAVENAVKMFVRWFGPVTRPDATLISSIGGGLLASGDAGLAPGSDFGFFQRPQLVGTGLGGYILVTPGTALGGGGGLYGSSIDVQPSVWDRLKSGWGSAVGGGDFADIERRHQLPGGLLDQIYALETSRGRDLSTSKAGAQGYFQIMPGTGAEFGLKDPWNLSESAEVAAKILDAYTSQFGGDVEKGAAAYNAGPGRVRQAVERANAANLPASWKNYLPDETQRYVQKIDEFLRAKEATTYPKLGQATVNFNVRIDNRTGSNPVITTSQLAVPVAS